MYFCSRPKKNATSPRKTVNGLLVFFRENTFRQIMEIFDVLHKNFTTTTNPRNRRGFCVKPNTLEIFKDFALFILTFFNFFHFSMLFSSFSFFLVFFWNFGLTVINPGGVMVPPYISSSSSNSCNAANRFEASRRATRCSKEHKQR